eukprot:TRINITY_DN6989_c1_g3_i1.p1 TRINITY_DN6989_c1_g3~~TRINITY_DN6989_c1_g3_i1.p1  ORF type:complete len:295 (+),score=40.86 TRINITY_DN6989_c1_g3_i1:150-1034(+)
MKGQQLHRGPAMLVVALLAACLSRCRMPLSSSAFVEVPRGPLVSRAGWAHASPSASTAVVGARPQMATAATSTSSNFPGLCMAATVLAMLGTFSSKKGAGSSSPRVVATSKIAMKANFAWPSGPRSAQGKRRQRAGRSWIFRGRQVSVRVNRKTNKPIKYIMHVKAGDWVQIVRGKDAGKVTQVFKVFPKWNRVLCLGVNYCIKHVRPRRDDDVGQRVQVEAPLSATNVMHYCKKTGKAGMLGVRFEMKETKPGYTNVKRIRYNRASGEIIPQLPAPKWIPVLDRLQDEEDDDE